MSNFKDIFGWSTDSDESFEGFSNNNNNSMYHYINRSQLNEPTS